MSKRKGFVQQRRPWRKKNLISSPSLADREEQAISLLNEALDHHRELVLFNDIATIAAQSLNLEEVIDQVLDLVLYFLPAAAGLFLLWDSNLNRVTCSTSRGLAADDLQKITPEHLGKMLGSGLITATEPLIIGNAALDPDLATFPLLQFLHQKTKLPTVVSIPLWYRDRLIGFLSLAATAPVPVKRRNFFSILGNQIGFAIENARLSHELRRSERRYRRIFEGSKDMIFVTNLDGHLLDINPAGVELLGFHSKLEAVELFDLSGCFYHQGDWERFQLRTHFEGFVRDMEVTLVKQYGGRIQVLLTVIVRKNRRGEKTGYDGIIKDITARKRIEQEILKAKKTTEGILEGMPVPTFVIDRNHRIIYWNRACEELTGYPRQEMIDSRRQWLPFYLHERPSMANLVVEQNVKALERFYGDKNLQKSPNLPGAFEAYERFENLRGQERYLYFSASPIYGDQGQIVGAVQVILDMTEREKLARNLKESEEKFRRLVESSLDGIALHTQKKLLYANNACLKIFGYSRLDELMGQDLFNLIAPTFQQAFLRYLPEISRRTTKLRTFELKGIKKDLTEIDLELVTFPTNYEGQPAFQTHLRDITDKKRLEEQLLRSEKMAALGQLAAGVAHEINNPLGGILVYSYLILEDMEPNRPERPNVEKIVREATRCKEIIKGLLDFSRHLPARMTDVDINTLLEEVLSLVENHLNFQYITVKKLFAPHLPSILGDKSKLEQVFINLFMNAAEAMAGQGFLTLSTNAGRDDGCVQIRVTDSGPGIPAAYLPRLFDPFFSTKDVGRGVGLGLSISYGIIAKHRGRIYVDTTESSGTTFVIELPVQKSANVEEKKEAES